MGDSTDEEGSRDSDSSGRQTPVIRSRSVSIESARSERGCLSRTSERSEDPQRERSRSRSPRVTAEMQSLREENRKLRSELAKMTTVISQLQSQNKALQDQLQAQEAQMNARHGESMKQLSMIHSLLQVENKKRKAPEDPTNEDEMETDQPGPAGPEEPAQKRPAQRECRPKEQALATSQAQTPRTQEVAQTPRAQKPTAQTAPSQTTSAGPSQPTKEQRIPPVILRKAENWSTISKELIARRIQVPKARKINDGIQMLPASVEDYRKLTRFLNEGKHEYHTYSLPEEKLLRVVIRGLPDGIPLEDVKEDLETQGFSPRLVQRMTSRRTKKTIPLVLVQLPPTDMKILELTRCCSLVVKTEPQKQTQGVSQCHRCQKFWHAQRGCCAAPRCVKCGGDHHSGECKKARTEPAKCANCEGPHPASYQGCPRFPKKKPAAKPAPQAKTTPARTQTQPAKPNGTGTRTFAEAAKKGPAKSAKPAPAPATGTNIASSDLKAMFQQMQRMCSAMSAFFDQLPELQQG